MLPLASRIAALAALLAPAVALAAEPRPGDPRNAVFNKLEYDRSYFEQILALRAAGKVHSALNRDEMEKEVRRATAYVPVLRKLLAERAAFERGAPLTIPPADEVYRVYRNLFTLLNMVQAAEAGKWQGVVDSGSRLVIRGARDLGVVRSDDNRYYLDLYREFFYRMAVAHYRLGNDHEAVTWLARLEADANVQALRKKLGEEQKPADTRAERLALLQTRPVAVMPLTPLRPDKDSEWMGQAFAETFTNDLVQYTDLVVVERIHLAKVMKEVGLSQAGVTDEGAAKRVGGLLGAGSLVTGTWLREGKKVVLGLRLVDGETGQALGAAEGALDAGEGALDAGEGLVGGAREVLLRLLGDAGWISDTAAANVRAARQPSMETLRELLQARLLLASRAGSAQARELYAKAMKQDPALAKAFEDLKKEFSGLSANLAVMPFVNSSGAREDLWMPVGVGEALSTDLPVIGFRVVERRQLAAVLAQRGIGEVIDPEQAKDAGKLAGADFVVLGSVLHQKPRVRADVRFTDVRTGIAITTASAEAPDDDFPRLLRELAQEIAKRFNEKLTDEQLAQLAGGRMSRDDFERWARAQLAKETLARREAKKDAAKQAPKQYRGPPRSPAWIAASGVVVGLAAAGGGTAMALRSRDQMSYADALLAGATRQEDVDRLTRERNKQRTAMRTWTGVGIGGAVLAGGSAAYLVWRNVRPQPPPEDAEAVLPLVTPVPGGGVLSLAGRF